jgi:hypothetical protein
MLTGYSVTMVTVKTVASVLTGTPRYLYPVNMTTQTQDRANGPVRPLHVIAAEISADWRPPWFGAVPYLQAMRSLDKITDNYGADDADGIVRYFLVNAKTWRGETARRIKAELNALLKAGR